MAEPLPITDIKDLRRIYAKNRQNRDPARSNLRTIHALDTETCEGNLFLIADSGSRYLDKITPESVLQFLFHKKYHTSWNFFYNLGYDAEVILKLLGNQLYQYKNKRKLVFKFEEYNLTYIPNKCLRITKGHHSVSFYDIAQFYNRVGLANAYQNNIGKLDQEYLDVKSKRAQFSPWFYSHNKNKVRNYCIQDCKLTKELAEKWIKLFYDAFLFYPVKWFSSGYLAEKVLINSGIEFPMFNSIPYEIQEFAFRSYFGGRFEMFKRGFIGEAYLYDINSAYPYSITNIPDLTKGKWVQRKTIHPRARLGFFRIRADIPDEKYMPPFPFRVKNLIIFPSGRFETYVTLEELKACENPDFYTILDSWQFVSESETYPYREFIEKMYLKRLELKARNDPMQLPIKIILNSIYGKTGQTINRIIGNLFNPVIFASITGFTRAQLYRFAIEHGMERDTVAFATDSICTRKKLEIDSTKLGEFSFVESANDVYQLQNGFRRFNEKWKQRGLGKWKGDNIEHLDTIERDGKLFYKFKMLRNTRLRSSIIGNKISEIGKIKQVTREINLNADRKRFWLGRIETIDSKIMNESVPISMNHFQKEWI